MAKHTQATAADWIRIRRLAKIVAAGMTSPEIYTRRENREEAYIDLTTIFDFANQQIAEMRGVKYADENLPRFDQASPDAVQLPPRRVDRVKRGRKIVEVEHPNTPSGPPTESA